MLNIRRFVIGADEPVWVEVLNAAHKEYESWWRPITVEEMREREELPNFDFKGRFIAELDGKPVGIVHARVDRSSEEKKGFMHTFCVIPEFRGRGIEEKLIKIAMSELEKRRMSLAQAWIGCKRNDRIQLLERLGFKLVYKTFDMKIALTNIPSNIGENTEVTIRLLRKNVEEDMKTLNWLWNGCFKEHLHYRLRTIEETRDRWFNDPHLKEQEFLFAVLDQKSVGFIGVGVDEKYNIEKNVKSGSILTIGVLKPYRSEGIGTKLVLQGLKTLRAKGMTKAMLDTDDFNQNAIRLYEKVGFTVVQEYSTYEKRLHAGISSATREVLID